MYAFDPRDKAKQRRAREILKRGFEAGSIRIAHQAVVEFFSVVTRRDRKIEPLLGETEARREVEELMAHVDVLYPNDAVVRAAIRGAATYQLSWYDAHMWAYAEVFGLDELISEDFQHDRLYGTVRVVNPFR